MSAKSRRTIAFMAACGLLCALAAIGAHWRTEFDVSFDGEDEVNLLQERVLERHLSKKLADGKPAVQLDTKVPSVCDEVSGKVGSLSLAGFESARDGPQPTVEVPAAKIEPLVDDMEVAGASPESEESYSTILRNAFDVLIVIVLLDRCRCLCTHADEVKDGDVQTSIDKEEVFKQLMRAAAAGDEAGVREKLHQGALVTEKDVWGCTPLHAVAKGGCTQLVGELIDLGAQVDAVDLWEETPLHIAARAGHVSVCEALISRGASVDVPNAQSFTPLVVAGHADRTAVIFMLLQKGAGAGDVAKKNLPALLRELLFNSKHVLPEELQAEIHHAEVDEDVRQWPTDEDWEEHMMESIDNSVGA